MATKKFKVQAVRTITSPSNKTITTYYVWVDFRDLPTDFSLEVNPRKPKMNTAVAKQLITAVITPDIMDFDINNRGIVLTAKSLKFDSSKSIVTIDFDDDIDKYGVLDGGHTYTAIINNVDKMSKDLKKFVKLEVVVGDSLDVTSLADARNTSAQVSDIALFELDDKFDLIKNAIKNESYADEVAYKDNDNKSIQAVELIKLLFAFNIKRFPDDSSVPVSAYSGKAAVFKDYKKEYSHTNNIYENLAPILPNLVNLYELIQEELPKKYQEYKLEDGKNAKFGLVRGVEGSGEFLTFFSRKKIAYQISIGYLLPIFGSFRALLINNDGDINWEFDPKEIWEKSGVRLVQNTFDTDTNPQLVGKSKTLWQSNYRIVDSVRKDMLLAKLMSNH
ncbi:AIPR family protein [Brochothrix thermosphacta]|uniref:AIPR family protein n=1 Tax=Brochothrix thermosphacta TaxID=2756 RepID=UPI00265D2DC8|nr:AIPR family protein [Brochothrix thermosphacta]WKK69966.1 AIPR family protein [Brochothrix thermosphacta]